MTFCDAKVILYIFKLTVPRRALLLFCTVQLPTLLLAKIEQWRRIVDGLDAVISNFPAVVVLQFLGGSGTICTGVIIHPRWLLSAAHCFNPEEVGLRPDNTQVRAGSSYASSGGEIYYLELAIVHHLYDTNWPFNDIGIAKTTEPFRLSQAVRIADIVNEQTPRPSPGSICTVVGYGKTTNPDWDRAELMRLRYRDVPILENEECESRWAYDRNTMFCAGSPTQLVGSNHGDSGGPVFCNGVAVALVEGGPNRWESYGPNVYTEIRPFLPDIQRVIATM